MPGNNKIILNVSGNDGNPVHGDMAGFFAAQGFVDAAVVKGKSVCRRLGQFHRQNFDCRLAVGSQRQNVFGIGSQNYLSHQYRIRSCRQRNLPVNGAKFNVLGQRAGLFHIKNIGIVGKHRLFIVIDRTIALNKQDNAKDKDN